MGSDGIKSTSPPSGVPPSSGELIMAGQRLELALHCLVPFHLCYYRPAWPLFRFIGGRLVNQLGKLSAASHWIPTEQWVGGCGHRFCHAAMTGRHRAGAFLGILFSQWEGKMRAICFIRKIHFSQNSCLFSSVDFLFILWNCHADFSLSYPYMQGRVRKGGEKDCYNKHDGFLASLTLLPE